MKDDNESVNEDERLDELDKRSRDDFSSSRTVAVEECSAVSTGSSDDETSPATERIGGVKCVMSKALAIVSASLVGV